MPRRADLGKIPAVDLAYAVNRLIQEGKTSLAEVRRFTGERPARIAALERELATLKAGHAAAKKVGRPPGPRATAVKKPKRKFTMTPKARAARKSRSFSSSAFSNMCNPWSLEFLDKDRKFEALFCWQSNLNCGIPRS